MTRQSYKISRNICEITEHGPSRFFHFFEIGDTVAGSIFAQIAILNADFTGCLARLAVQVLVQTTGLRTCKDIVSCFFIIAYMVGESIHTGHQFISGSPDVTAFEYMTL